MSPTTLAEQARTILAKCEAALAVNFDNAARIQNLATTNSEQRESLRLLIQQCHEIIAQTEPKS